MLQEMFRPWPEESQKELRNVVIALWSVMVTALVVLPGNATFDLWKFPLLLHSVFLVMVICWGVFLFFQVLSLLPIGRFAKKDMIAYSLLWFALIPSISWLFWVIVALDVTYPFIDPIVEPLFLVGVVTASYLYTNYVTEGRLSVRLRRLAVWLWCRARTRARSVRGFRSQLRI